MKRFAFLVAIAICFVVSSDAYAQNGLLGRLFRSRRNSTAQYYSPTYQQGYRYTPTYQQSYQPTASSQYYTSQPSRIPTPVTGYGSNLHRNYMIRRAQQRAATTGIQPRNTGNIYWSR